MYSPIYIWIDGYFYIDPIIDAISTDVPMFNTSINNKVYSTTTGVLLAADILIMAAHLATQPQQQQQQQEQDDTIATHLEHLQELKDAVQDFTKVHIMAKDTNF